MTQPRVINGHTLAKDIRRQVRDGIRSSAVRPGLAIVLVGDDSASRLYVDLKERTSKRLGFTFERREFPRTAAEQEIVATIQELNADAAIHGIVVQLPLPTGLNTERILDTVALAKDVDGLSTTFQRRVQNGHATPWLPALIASICALLKASEVSLAGRTALLAAKSDQFRHTLRTVLKQCSMAVENAATPSQARARAEHADVVITAFGAPQYLVESDLKSGSVVIDVGLNEVDGKRVGDFAGPQGLGTLQAYSPVPGGVGPVTVATLLANTLTASQLSNTLT